MPERNPSVRLSLESEMEVVVMAAAEMVGGAHADAAPDPII